MLHVALPVIVVLSVCCWAAAQDKPGASPVAPQAPAKPETPEEVADKVRTAVAAKDDATLKALAAKDEPDPWLVADELCAQSRFEAAEAFAKAAPRVDVEALRDYVLAQLAKPTDPELRRALASANAALAAGKLDDALAALDTSPHEGRDLVAIRLEHARGLTLRGQKRLEESANALESAAQAASTLGWLAGAVRLFHESGHSAYMRSDLAFARRSFEARLEIEQRRGNRANVASTLANLGVIHEALGNFAQALDMQQRALALTEELGDRAGISRALRGCANIHRRLGDCRKALDFQERALKLAEGVGDRGGISMALASIGLIHKDLGDYPTALDFQERALALMEELGDRAASARTLGSIGSIYKDLGDYEKALGFQERSLKLSEELGDRGGVARGLEGIGILHQRVGEYQKAIDCQERALKLTELVGDRAGVARILGNLGAIYVSLNDYPSALDLQHRALQLAEDLGARQEAAIRLVNIGAIHQKLGEYPRALDYLNRGLSQMEELGNRAGAAAALGNIGVVYQSLGDDARALDVQLRALQINETIGDRDAIAIGLGNVGNTYRRLGATAKALEFFGRSLKLREELGDRGGVATTLGNIGTVHMSLEDWPRALEFLERAVQLTEELGARAEAARWLGNLGEVHRKLGHLTTALDLQERSLCVAEELGDRRTQVNALSRIAAVHRRAGRMHDAVAVARGAVGQMAGLVHGMGEEHGATARGEFVVLFDIGASAAAASGDTAATCFFLESGRAGALLESLAARGALGPALLPDELRVAEAAARGREAAAAIALRRAEAAGNVKEIAAARAVRDAARDTVLDVIAGIQREAKAAAAILYPEPDSLDGIRGRLADGDALVLYGLFSDDMLGEDPIALVVTVKEQRVVALPKTTDIAAACAALVADRPDTDPTEAVAALRKLVVEPLDLDANTTRILVSPYGVLSYVPFALLMPEREVCCVPSGTTYGVLLGDAARKGNGVLALGDPDYDVRSGEHETAAVMRGGMRLVRLPQTGVEAKAIGDVVLTGRDATEAALRDALIKRPRWRAVHLACHGLVDPERPMFSSLALTPSGEDDGLMSALEVFRMKCPADLVVLSACETGMGKVYKAEGIVGLTRAFMFAGAPRVLVSLWRVDDEATAALMAKFYEGFKRDIPATRALREAQAFVRSHEKWKHPSYWAAWVLWGLPE